MNLRPGHINDTNEINEASVRQEIEYLVTWYYVSSYLAPILYSIVVIGIGWSLLSSLDSDEGVSIATQGIKATIMLAFVAAIPISRYMGRRYRVRAEDLRIELTQFRSAQKQQSVSASATSAEHSIGHSLRHGFVMILFPRESRRGVYTALLAFIVVVGIAWGIILAAGLGVSLLVTIVLLVPLICLGFITLMLYALARRARNG